MIASLSTDVNKIRREFPALNQSFKGKPLVYFDNAATTQKPQAIIDTIKNFYCFDNANVHRGIHTLSERASAAYEMSRETVRQFIHAKDIKEIIFVPGTTAGINLVAQSYGDTFLSAGDEIIISAMEHHSNIVPWQMLCQRIGTVLKVIPMSQTGELLLDEYQNLFTTKTKLVALVHLSNALGTINPIAQMIKIAHQNNAHVLIDGAQAVSHMAVDVQALDCDFYIFSGHKIYAPTGIGVVYGKEHLLNAMVPYQGGGSMIKTVSFTKTTYAETPAKFEAGTPNITGAIGLGSALHYIQQIGLDNIYQYEMDLTHYATQRLAEVPHLHIIGNAKHKSSVISFVLDDVHPHDIGTLLNNDGIAVRSGHHCTMPIMQFYQIPATVRASLAFYNTKEEIDKLIISLAKIREVFVS